MISQETQVLEYLKEHGKITSMEAITEFGITRLSGRILRLRRDGHKIETVMTTGRTRTGHSCTYATYVLKEA